MIEPKIPELKRIQTALIDPEWGTSVCYLGKLKIPCLTIASTNVLLPEESCIRLIEALQLTLKTLHSPLDA